MVNAPNVITFGEAMALFVASEPGPLSAANTFAKRAAGAELNVAIGLARLGHRVGWISRLGRDSFGRFILDTLDAENIDASCVTIDEQHPTGMMLKDKCDDGSDPKTEYFRKGSAASHLSIDDYVREYVLGARHLHLTGIAPALSSSVREFSFHVASEMKTAGNTVSFDPNLRPSLWRSRTEMVETLNALAAYADVVMPGLGEGGILTGLEHPEDIADYYLDRGAKLVIVKLGESGAYFRTESASGISPSIPVAKVVDTVGAGDGFAVGVLSAIIEGKTAEEAVARGNWIGSLAVQVIGDSEGLPTRDALMKYEAAQKIV